MQEFIVACMVERLKKRADFLNCAKGKRWVTPNFTLQARQRTEDLVKKPSADTDFTYVAAAQCARLGYTVTKKAGNSVQRNRIKRRLKSAISILTPLFFEGNPAQPSFDYVLIGRDTILRLDFTILINELRSAFEGVHRARSSAKPSRNADF